LGKGSTFTVMLPLSPVYRREEAEKKRTHARTAEGEPLPSYEGPERLDGLKVLVVDDERDTLDMLKVGLSASGAQVRAVGSAAEALAAFGEDPPDVLISDIGMPDVDGYQLIRQLRELPPERGGAVPAIALTAYARTEDRLQALRAGYQMHVPKPVELAELIAVASSLVRRVK
jgi:CheY-like chemotaxis protein